MGEPTIQSCTGKRLVRSRNHPSPTPAHRGCSFSSPSLAYPRHLAYERSAIAALVQNRWCRRQLSSSATGIPIATVCFTRRRAVASASRLVFVALQAAPSFSSSLLEGALFRGY
mmetsp:Transcript_6006/g.13064  ORF Transcript_6006/g.13064 Transcript_6006/m.13064 type:complete len:114 (-) Transcript_6006:530-871(-)